MGHLPSHKCVVWLPRLRVCSSGAAAGAAFMARKGSCVSRARAFMARGGSVDTNDTTRARTECGTFSSVFSTTQGRVAARINYVGKSAPFTKSCCSFELSIDILFWRNTALFCYAGARAVVSTGVLCKVLRNATISHQLFYTINSRQNILRFQMIGQLDIE
mgnify:CR=1 FL=1